MDISSIIKRMYDMKIIFFCMDILVYELLLFCHVSHGFVTHVTGLLYNHLDNLSYRFVNDIKMTSLLVCTLYNTFIHVYYLERTCSVGLSRTYNRSTSV